MAENKESAKSKNILKLGQIVKPGVKTANFSDEASNALKAAYEKVKNDPEVRSSIQKVYSASEGILKATGGDSKFSKLYDDMAKTLPPDRPPYNEQDYWGMYTAVREQSFASGSPKGIFLNDDVKYEIGIAAINASDSTYIGHDIGENLRIRVVDNVQERNKVFEQFKLPHTSWPDSDQNTHIITATGRNENGPMALIIVSRDFLKTNSRTLVEFAKQYEKDASTTLVQSDQGLRPLSEQLQERESLDVRDLSYLKQPLITSSSEQEAALGRNN